MAEEIDPKKMAQENVDRLMQDFPGIRKEMEGVAAIVVMNMAHMSAYDMVYRSLMTGATIMADKHRKAQKSQEDILAKVMAKKT